jgi:hypothetical protein
MVGLRGPKAVGGGCWSEVIAKGGHHDRRGNSCQPATDHLSPGIYQQMPSYCAVT